MTEKALHTLRGKIDELDKALLKLLNERAAISVEIGKLKAESGLEICDRGREASVFGHLAQRNLGPLTETQVNTIFHEIIMVSRELQSSQVGGAGRQVAPGPRGRLPHLLSGTTAVYGILGNPVAQSMSPLMHGVAFRRVGIDAVYLPFEVTDLEAAVSGMKALGVKGASVTHPFKTQILDLIDKIDDTAQKIGAVNTLVFREDGIKGTNTDWIGAVKCLETLLPIEGHQFIVLGAGGAARAVVFGVMSQGGGVTVINRSAEKGQALAEEFDCQFASLDEIGAVQGDCLVNTTPVGMHPNVEEIPVPGETLKGYKAVADAIYNPMKTRLLREAEAAGCAVAGGFDMFLYQGTEQFSLWTGKEPPVALMREVVLARLQTG
jgi:shikimate dehydrogenase